MTTISSFSLTPANILIIEQQSQVLEVAGLTQFTVITSGVVSAVYADGR